MHGQVFVMVYGFRIGNGLYFRRVLGAGAVASTARAIIETPLEFAKVWANDNRILKFSLFTIKKWQTFLARSLMLVAARIFP